MDHDHYSDSYLRTILATVRTIAVVGASPKPERPSHYVMRYLIERGYDCIPVNPGQAGGTILGRTAYRSLAELPAPVDMVDVFRNSEAAGRVVDEALALPVTPKAIWMQMGIRNDAAAARAEAAGVQVVMDRCPKIEIPRLFGRGTPPS
jgi:predicted CoA-binding protein